MKKALLIFLSLSSLNLFAASSYYPANFKQAVNFRTLRDSNLKKRLFQVLSLKHIRLQGKDDVIAESCDEAKGFCYSQKSLSYQDARKLLFGVIHKEEDRNGGYVKDVYCRKTVRISDDPDRVIPRASVMNCEHTWPQSRFNNRFPKEIQKTDIHHLYPADSKANSERGNHEFAEVNGARVGGCAGSYLGSSIGDEGLYFEPPDEHKGNVARALFYFSIRYQSPISEVEEEALRKWHELDPVDQEERDRNEKIFEIQGNRNPFVDYPSLVKSISNF